MCEVDERYQRGQIYTIRNITDDAMIYVGSTISPLPKRFYIHKQSCLCGKSTINLYNYITDNDWSNWYIELYEDFPCNSKKELERREGQVIRDIGTLNKVIAGRTHKEYREDNADKINERKKKNYEGNKDVVLEKMKKYYQDNADTIKERNKKYYQNNADKIKERRVANSI